MEVNHLWRIQLEAVCPAIKETGGTKYNILSPDQIAEGPATLRRCLIELLKGQHKPQRRQMLAILDLVLAELSRTSSKASRRGPKPTSPRPRPTTSPDALPTLPFGDS